MHRYNLSLWFVLTSVFMISAAAIVVNLVIGNLAERNLVRIAEENTARDADHLRAMMRRQLKSTLKAAGTKTAEQETLSLEFLEGPLGLPKMFASLAEGLNIVKFNLLDLNGDIVWSTDSEASVLDIRETPFFEIARRGGVSSKLAKNLC